VFNDLKRSLKSDESISSYWAVRLSHTAIRLVLIAIRVEESIDLLLDHFLDGVLKESSMPRSLLRAR
jgi:hypothetical protein